MQEIEFDEAARNNFYDVVFNRRDVRGQFKPDAIPNEVLSRILTAAHHAPSVGFMQPWNFILIKDQETKSNVHTAFTTATEEAAQMFEGDKRELYQKLKLEGILESPINICVTCDRSRTGPVVIGRTHIKSMDLFSTVCAVQNLWLAARAEGLGLGWVSIVHQEALLEALNIPKEIVPIAYLCLGYVSHFKKQPELKTAGWLPRLPLEDLIYFDQWGQQDHAERDGLMEQIQKNTKD